MKNDAVLAVKELQGVAPSIKAQKWAIQSLVRNRDPWVGNYRDHPQKRTGDSARNRWALADRHARPNAYMHSAGKELNEQHEQRQNTRVTPEEESRRIKGRYDLMRRNLIGLEEERATGAMGDSSETSREYLGQGDRAIRRIATVHLEGGRNSRIAMGRHREEDMHQFVAATAYVRASRNSAHIVIIGGYMKSCFGKNPYVFEGRIDCGQTGARKRRCIKGDKGGVHRRYEKWS